MAAAHHRLNYIHPFPDGNSWVSRLKSHAMALQAGIGAYGLWSVSRSLARGLESRDDYPRMMDYADAPRQGDLDGRGNLSLKALNEFAAWFLNVCIDQVTFMEGLFALDTLASRLKNYVDQRAFRVEAFTILEYVLLHGELARGEVDRVRTNRPSRPRRSCERRSRARSSSFARRRSASKKMRWRFSKPRNGRRATGCSPRARS